VGGKWDGSGRREEKGTVLFIGKKIDFDEIRK